MKLANIHKHYVALLLIIGGFQSAQAQTWTLQQCIDTAQVQAKDSNDDLFMNEAADLLYHFLVLLKAKKFSFIDIESVLKSRS